MTRAQRITELEGWGDLLSLGVDRISQPVEGMHRAVVDSALRWTGRRGEGTRRMVGSVIAVSYDAVRTAASIVGSVVDLGIESAAARIEGPRRHWRPGNRVRAGLNAVWGDDLGHRGRPIGMGVRNRDGDSVTPASPDLAAAFPAATPRVVVLVHGLGQTESCWLGAGSKRPLGLWDRLDSDPSLTTVGVRYNSGRQVSENGADLAVLLEELALAWPVPIESIALVGSSMGGLIVRSACHSGLVAGSKWVDAVTQVVTLASPHLGAPLEKAAHIASWGLRVAPQSRPLAAFLDTRSAGIKDLRLGSIVAGDRGDVDRYSPASVDNFEILEGVDHLFVAAVVSSDPGHPLGVLFGDLMVRPGSGTGRGRRRRIEAKEVRVLGGLRHSGLIHDANLQNLVIEWLTPKPEKPAAVGFP